MPLLTAKRGDMCFCPGCSHGCILEHLADAIERLGLPPERICLVSDIGCIGMADRYFTCHTFHGLHGRSITYAEGIKRVRPDALVVVLIGDGGCGIGTAHLVHAARRGADIKVIVCNNFNFGMTGGQHSATTPLDGRTLTTLNGASEHPFDICATVTANGAAHVARFSALDADVTDRMETALRAPGFALLDLWELCTAYFMPQNELKPNGLYELSQRLGMPFGVLASRTPAAPPPAGAAQVVQPVQTVAASLSWPRRTEICLAGSAGQRIRSAAGVLGEIATAAGLFAAQQDDFPVTVQRGHSLSNLVLSPERILYAGVDSPDLVVVLSEEGLCRLGSLAQLSHETLVLADERIALPDSPARFARFDLRRVEREAGKASGALAALFCGLAAQGWAGRATLLTAASQAVRGKYREENLRAIRVGLATVPVANDGRNGGTFH